MKINKLSKHLFYKNTLKQLSYYELDKYACEHNLYNDIDFLNYFKNTDKILWVNVILKSKIPAKKLFWKFSNIFYKLNLFDQILNKYIDLNDYLIRNGISINSQHFISRERKRLKEILDEYPKSFK